MRVALLLLLAAATASAQEFGRASGGTIEAVTKSASAPVSGALEARTDGSYGLSLGGTALKDRIYFFASTSMASEFAPSIAPSTAIDSKIIANLDDRNVLAAAFSQEKSSFLSLRYDVTASNNLFFTARFLTRKPLY